MAIDSNDVRETKVKDDLTAASLCGAFPGLGSERAKVGEESERERERARKEERIFEENSHFEGAFLRRFYSVGRLSKPG